jgi:hypothetical protein
MDKVTMIALSESENLKLYTSFMFHKRNAEFEKLIQIYEQIEKTLNEEK